MKTNSEIKITHDPDTLSINCIRYLIDFILLCRHFLEKYGVREKLNDKVAELAFSITSAMDCAAQIKTDDMTLHPVMCFRVSGNKMPGVRLAEDHMLCAPSTSSSMHESIYQLCEIASKNPELFQEHANSQISMDQLLKIKKLMYPWENNSGDQ